MLSNVAEIEQEIQKIQYYQWNAELHFLRGPNILKGLSVVVVLISQK